MGVAQFISQMVGLEKGKSIYKWMIMVYKLRYTGNKRQIQWTIMVYKWVYIYIHIIIVCDLHLRV